MKRTLEGIIAPVLTPFSKDGNVNIDMYKRICKYIIDNGVNGLFVCGTTGVFTVLTTDERKILAEAAMNFKDNKTKVIVNISSMKLTEIRELIDHAKSIGADGISAAAPCYHIFDDTAMFQYFKYISSYADDMDLYLYNVPSYAKNFISPPLLGRLAKDCSNIRGIKDSSMDHMTLLRYQDVVDDSFSIITGNDGQVLTALQAGAHGGIVAIAGVFPKLLSGIYSKFLSDDIEGAKKDQRIVIRLRDMFRGVMPIVSHAKALELIGFNMCAMRMPFRELNDQESKRIEKCLKDNNLI